MSECMMSTPNLEGGLINSDLVSSWTLFFIPGDVLGTPSTKTLPFQVKHLIYLTTFGTTIGSVSGSIDIVDGGDLHVITPNGWTLSKITLQGDIVTSSNLYQSSRSAIFYFIAVPA